MFTFEDVSFFDVLELEDLTVKICPNAISDLGWCYEVDRRGVEVWLPRNYTNQPPVLLNPILSNEDWKKAIKTIEFFIYGNEELAEYFATSEADFDDD